MKKILFILFAICIFSHSINAQGNGERKEKIEAMKVAYITEKLNLTVEEAQQFWPIYNEFHAAQQALRKDMRGAKREMSEMTESEANTLLQKMLDSEEEKLKLRKMYLVKLKEVMPSQKILKLVHAEKTFRAELVKKLKQNRGGQKGREPRR